MDYVSIIQKMKVAGVCFSSGLTHDTIAKIEKLYEIRFPDSLRMFYQTALPISVGDTEFSRWDDFSPENVAAIRRRMEAPYEWLKRDIERGFWLPAWDGKTVEELLETSPKLIPIFSHRYMPMLNEVDPPVISTVGRDTICYSVTLMDYLCREFCDGGTDFEEMKVPYIPLWSDILGEADSQRRYDMKRQALLAIVEQFPAYDVRFFDTGDRLDIINPFGKDPISVYVENDPDTPYMVCFSFQHRHLATIDEAIAYANDIIGGNVFAIEFFKGGRNLVGGDLDALELRALPQEIPERFLGQGQIKLFDVADAFKVRGWGKGTDFDGKFTTDEQGNVSIQINQEILSDT